MRTKDKRSSDMEINSLHIRSVFSKAQFFFFLLWIGLWLNKWTLCVHRSNAHTSGDLYQMMYFESLTPCLSCPFYYNQTKGSNVAYSHSFKHTIAVYSPLITAAWCHPRFMRLFGGKQARRKEKKAILMESRKWQSSFAILLTFSRKTLAYLGRGGEISRRLNIPHGLRVVFFHIAVPTTR